MTSLREQFLAEVEAYLQASGMNPSDFGGAVLKDRSFVTRLRKGRDVTTHTIDKVRRWIERHPPKARPSRAREVRPAA